MKKRIEQLDYMKCVFILLMIAFHLVYIGDTYPYAKHVVYTFHMPGFLVISGYLFNVGKPLRRFLRSILWIFIPYAIMESGYVLAASVLPIREHIDNLTLPLLLSKLFLNPLGPYWYLHTLMVCGLIYYISDRLSHVLFSRIIGQSISQSSIPNPQSFPLQSPILNPQSLFIKTYLSPLSSLLSPLFFIIAACALPHCGVALSFPNACYFLAGMVLRQYVPDFLPAFPKQPWTILPVILIACIPAWLDKSHPAGILMVYFVMSFLMYLCRHTPRRVLIVMTFIGRNTLPLLLFSPLFTILAKLYQPHLLRLEPSGALFLLVSVFIATAGSLAIAWVSDKLRISLWFFGREKSIS